MINCPIDNTKVELSKKIICPKCKEDLTSLGRMMELPYLFFNEGLRLTKEQKCEEAIQKLSVAAEMKRGFTKPLVVIGKIYAQKGMYSEAIQYWERVLVMEPDNDGAKKALEKARELMEKEITGEPRPEPEMIQQIKKLSSRMRFVPAFIGIVAVLLVGSTAFFWYHLNNQRSQISELNNSLSDLRFQTSENLGGVSTQIQQLNTNLLEESQEIDTKIDTLRESSASHISALSARINYLQRTQRATNDSLEMISKRFNTLSSENNTRISATENAMSKDLTRLQEELDSLSNTFYENQRSISGKIDR